MSSNRQVSKLNSKLIISNLTAVVIFGITTRIRTLGPWTVTGEIGAFSGYHAPFSAIAEKEGLVYRLSEKNRKKMESEDQELAAEFHRLIIIMIGNQLMKASRAMVDSIN